MAAAHTADFNAPQGVVEKQVEANWVDARWQQTDVGPFLSATVMTPGQPTYKAIAIKVGDTAEATVCFDTDLLRMSAAWTGPFVKMSPARYGLAQPLAIGDGPIVFTTPAKPGWAKDDSFADPRARPFGPLPRDWAKWRGLYLSGKRVVLDYTVGGVEIRESPWCERREEVLAITRSFEIGPSERPLVLTVCEMPDAGPVGLDGSADFVVASGRGDVMRAIAAVGAHLRIDGGAVLLDFAPHEASEQVKLYFWEGPRASYKQFARLVHSSPALERLEPLTHGGPPHWGEPLATKGELGKPSGGFAVDSLTPPFTNPWKALLFASGHDFFPNGDAAVCTVHGDVWRVRGIDEKLDHLTWQRIATGLFQPLGLKIIGEKVHVLGRDQITVLEDLNGDGETDFYRNFNNDAEVDAGGHGYAACLETDAAGNFYTLRCASGTAHGGTLLRISPDGAKLEVLATGFRNPNGLGVGPEGTITVADQEGNWVPSTRLDVITPGGFYGYMPMHHRAEPPKTYDPPLCWIPKHIDNSASSQVWIPQGGWGALAGQMLHLSFGRSSMMLVLREKAAGIPQGGIVPLPVRFSSGVLRGRFNPRDGHLYGTGLRGWQTAGPRDGSLERVRCFPEKLQLPVAIESHVGGLRVTFSTTLQRATAEDPGSYDVQRWNYRWAESYGSKDWSVAVPEKQGRDTLEITAAKLSHDARTVSLSIADLRPAMQMQLRYNLNTAAGAAFSGELAHTIHALAAP